MRRESAESVAHAAEALRLIAEGHSIREVGRRLGLHHTTISGWYVRAQAAGTMPAPIPPPALPPLPATPSPQIPTLSEGLGRQGVPHSPITRLEWPVIEDDGSGFAIITDIHIPAFDREVILSWLVDAARGGYRRFLCLGDFFQFDPLGKFLRGMQVDVDLQTELQLGGEMIRAWMDGPGGGPFVAGHVLPGNHDERFYRHMARHGTPSFWLATLTRSDERVRWEDVGHLEVRSGGRAWHFFHGANYSKPNPAGVGVDLAERYQGNVCLGHQHLYARAQSRCGRFEAVALPGAYDPRRLHYTETAPRRGPAMTRGYGFLRDGQMEVRFIPSGSM